MGTFQYTPPELMDMKDSMQDQFKIESDMWSIGVIIYQLISGNLPFDSIDQNVLFQKVQSTDYEFLPKEVWDGVS